MPHAHGTAPLAPRGVYVAPYCGPNGEVVLLPITAEHRLATGAPVVVLNGSDPISESELLWGLLDTVDPVQAATPADEGRAVA